MKLHGENLVQAHICKVLSFCRLPYFSIPNGANKSQYAKLLFGYTGLKAGVPDLFIARVTSSGHHGTFIEVKNGVGGKLSPKQKQWIELLQNEGYAVRIVRSLKDLYQLIIELYPIESKHIHNINKLTLQNSYTQ